MARTAQIDRKTRETQIHLELNLDGSGQSRIATGVGFFDHMLTLLARHSLIDIEVQAAGDLETGSHHTVEDVGITLGQALSKALGDRSGIERYGSAWCCFSSCSLRRSRRKPVREARSSGRPPTPICCRVRQKNCFRARPNPSRLLRTRSVFIRRAASPAR